MKTKLLTLFLALVASTDSLFAYNGSCGNNVTWILSNGVLTLSGTGPMSDYDNTRSFAPWYLQGLMFDITTVIINTGVTSIGDHAFYGCTNLTNITIPNSVTSIGEAAFSGCSSLTSVTIPYSVTNVKEHAFSGCSNLQSINVATDNPNYYSADGVLFNKELTMVISCPRGKQGEYTIPNSVTSIGDYAFGWCKSLTSVIIPNSVKSIGRGAFAGCSELTSITIPNGVTNIGESTFSGCSSLTSVTIPNSVTSIGDYAFLDCASLMSITIPNNVTSIGYSVFWCCTSLTNITIPNGVTDIGEAAFYGCTSLTSVAIPNSVINIGESAFSHCALTRVFLPRSVTSLGDFVFSSCSSLASIVVENGNTVYDSRNNCNAIIQTESNTLIVGCKNSIIPNSVTSIESLAFCECTSLKSIEIPKSVTNIGRAAFRECTGLTNIEIPNSVTRLGSSAFFGCTGLMSITIPNSVTSIEYGTFYECTGLTSVTIGNGVRSIENSAFEGCSSLSSVHISDLTTWCEISFSSNSSNPLFYAQHLFLNDIEIIDLVIPNDVTGIGNFAFQNCISLKSVTIPNSVESIGYSAFYGCTSLTSITCEAIEPPTCDNDEVFLFVDRSIPLYVLANSISAYKTAESWKRFTNVLPIQAKDVNVTNVVVEPTDNSAVIQWPTVSGAYTYELVIKDRNGNIVCTLIFNEQGQLLSIALNTPKRNNAPQQAQTAGFAFTITGLDSGTRYTATIAAKASNGSVLNTKTVSFTTTGQPQAIDNVNEESSVDNKKIIRNGQLFVQQGDKTYNAQGVRVR